MSSWFLPHDQQRMKVIWSGQTSKSTQYSQALLFGSPAEQVWKAREGASCVILHIMLMTSMSLFVAVTKYLRKSA
jgi:hypothetical protein